MGRQQRSKTLPEDLVIKIMAMVPFPFIFKVRALSKSWQARFSPISSLDDGEEKRFAISFQKQMAGALMMEGCGLYVANVLTRSWKRLPTRSPVQIIRHPIAGMRPNVTKLVCGASLEFYNVILFYGHGFDYFAQIYDSKSNTWSSKKLVAPRKYWPVRDRSAYLDGILYMFADDVSIGVLKILAFNIRAETLEELKIPLINRLKNSELVVCGGSLWIVPHDGTICSDHLIVLKVDLAGGVLKVVEGAPAALKKVNILSKPVSDGHRIVWNATDRSVVEYNVVGDVWSILPCHGQMNSEWQGFPFQPGLNPFVEV